MNSPPRSRRSGRAKAATPAAPPPVTARGLATQAALVRAARAIFERDGFLDARVTDIAARAGAATGSFYKYFADKEAIFRAVADAVNEEVSHPPSLDDLPAADDEGAVVARIAANHRAYLEAYQRNAALMHAIEEVTNISADFRRQRTAGAQDVMRRNAEAIRTLQEHGHADPALDPLTAARALSVMVSRTAYVTFVLEQERSIGGLVETLTRLWVNALRIPVDEAAFAAEFGTGPAQ
jgi:AcrR family transcriptional regulator